MKMSGRLGKLTRRGFLALAAGGTAAYAYRREEGNPMPKPFSQESQPVAQDVPARPVATATAAATGGFDPISVEPSQVIDLTTWKLNLPANNQQVTQPALASFSDDAFRVVPAVQFTVTAGGEPLPGTIYPRSELREMNPDGTGAAWSTTSGVHTMSLTQRITHLPVVKPQLVCGQIHSLTEYLILVSLKGQQLFVKYKDSVAGVLDDNYQLGTYFDLVIQATQGYVDVSYNGARLVRQPMAETNCYFKAGCYLQSNTSVGDLPTAYGQVEISRLAVSHS
jgi:Alginate lyase